MFQQLTDCRLIGDVWESTACMNDSCNILQQGKPQIEALDWTIYTIAIAITSYADCKCMQKTPGVAVNSHLTPTRAACRPTAKWLLVLSWTQSCVEEPIKTEIALSKSTDKRTRVNKCCGMFLYKFECLEGVAHAPKPTFTFNGI